MPFKSAPDAVTAVVRGDVQMYFAPVNLSKELAEAGKVRAIASVTEQRIPDLPNVPTFREAGLNLVYNSWFGIMAPAGVPKDIVTKLNSDIVAILKTPGGRRQDQAAVRDRPSPTRREQFDKRISEETEKLTEMFKEVTNYER